MRISDWSSDVCSSDLARYIRRQNMPTLADALNSFELDELRDLSTGTTSIRLTHTLCRTRHHWELNTANGAISSVHLRLKNSGFTIFVTETKGNHVYLNIEPCPCFTVTTVALYPSRRTWKGGIGQDRKSVGWGKRG